MSYDEFVSAAVLADRERCAAADRGEPSEPLRLAPWQVELLERLARGEHVVVNRSRGFGRDAVMRAWAEAVGAAHVTPHTVDSYYDQQPAGRAIDEGVGATIDDLIDNIDAVLAAHRSSP